jgi:hypothetical protein
MQFDALQNVFLYIFIGVVLGYFLTKYYYEKTRNFALGKTIEGIMISKNIEEILSLSKDLNTIIEKLRLESDGLLDQIQKSRDIETYSPDNQSIEKSSGIKNSYEEETSSKQKAENENQ